MVFMQNSIVNFSIAIVALALIYPQLADRVRVLRMLVENAPQRLNEIDTFIASSVKFADRVRNCEDALMIEGDPVAILSCDPGRDLWNTVMGTFAPDLSGIPSGELFLYRYNTVEYQDSEALSSIELRDFPGIREFHPLGIEYHKSTSSLFVCNHHYNGSRIEVFSLNLDSPNPVATHQRTIISPLITSPNAITALNDHEFYVSNDHYFLQRENPVWALVETYAQLPLGSVAYVNMSTGDHSVEVRTVAHLPFSNGVALLNESALAVASSSTASVHFYEILHDRSLQKTGAIKLPFMPDNLSTDEKGTLLITGHPHPPSLDKLRKDRFKCLMSGSREPLDCYKGKAPSAVAEWTADGGVRTLYVTRDGFATSSTAVRDTIHKLGFVTGLYEKGIMAWKMQ